MSAHFLGRLHRESVRNPLDDGLAALIEEVASYGGLSVDPSWPPRDHALVLHLEMDGMALRLIGSVLAFDSARSPTLEELRIETFFPADEATADLLDAAASRTK